MINNKLKLDLLNKPSVIITIFCFLISIIFVYPSIQELGFIVDEIAHFKQIENLINSMEWEKSLTVIPGYHYMQYAIFTLLGYSDLFTARIINFIFSISNLYFIYKIYQHFKEEELELKTLNIYFNPIYFPFFFLVYTDLTALSFVLIAFYLMLIKRFYISAIFCFLSLLIRQTNILWVFFIYLYFLITSFEDFSLKSLFKLLLPSIGYWICSIAFIVFMIVNEGIAIGDKSMHPAFSFELGNSIFFLFTFAILMLPHLLGSLKQISVTFQESNYLWALSAFVFLLIFYNCEFTHEYNQSPNYIRNIVLLVVQNGFISRVSFSLIATIGFIMVYTTKFKEKVQYIIYPIFFLLICSSSLVEQRYYLVGLTFILLFMKDIKLFKLQLFYNLVLTIIVWSIVSQTGIFL